MAGFPYNPKSSESHFRVALLFFFFLLETMRLFIGSITTHLYFLQKVLFLSKVQSFSGVTHRPQKHYGAPSTLS